MRGWVAFLVISLVLGAVGAVWLERPSLVLLSVVPFVVWQLWIDEAKLIAALIVSPTLGGALGVSEWFTLYKSVLYLGLIRVVFRRVVGTPWRSLPWRVMLAYGLLLFWATGRELISGLPPPAFLLFDPISASILIVVYSQLTISSRVFSWLGIIAAAACLLQSLVVARELMNGDILTRAKGLAGEENTLAETTARVVPWMVAAVVVHKNLLWRAFLFAGTVGGVYAISGSGSRGGAVGLVLGGLAMLATSTDNMRKLVERVFITVFVAAVLLPFAPPIFYNRVVATIAPSWTDSEGRQTDLTSGRADQYKVLVEMIQERPAEGWSAGGYYDRWKYSHLGRETAVHSALLGVATQYGVPAALVWLAVMLSGSVAGFRVAQRWPHLRAYGGAASASCLANIAMSMTAPGAFHSALWAPVFFAHVLWIRSREKGFVAEAPERVAAPRRPALAGA